jgi:hypothetical protein
MSVRSIVLLGLLFLAVHAAHKFIHKGILRIGVMIFAGFVLMGAFTHPSDVVQYISATSARLWTEVISGTHQGTDAFFDLLHGFKRSVR